MGTAIGKNPTSPSRDRARFPRTVDPSPHQGQPPSRPPAPPHLQPAVGADPNARNQGNQCLTLVNLIKVRPLIAVLLFTRSRHAREAPNLPKSHDVRDGPSLMVWERAEAAAACPPEREWPRPATPFFCRVCRALTVDAL